MVSKRRILGWPYVVASGLALAGGGIGAAGGSLVIGSLLLATSVSVFTGVGVFQVLSTIRARDDRPVRGDDGRTGATAMDWSGREGV